MSANSKIEWTDHTFNPWIGCTKVSPACDDCYAARSTPARTMKVLWGAKEQRHRTAPSTWYQPRAWNAAHTAFFEKHGRRQRVFCASLADVFDKAVPDDWRMDLCDLIDATPNLDWLLLTKRIGNVEHMLPTRWLAEPRPHIWLGATVVNQEEADRDIPKLLATPARIHFVSMEPLLGPVVLPRLCDAGSVPGPGGVGGVSCSRCEGWSQHGCTGLDWVIVGGESGPNARPMHPDWARALRDQCVTEGVPFLFKQWGEWAPGSNFADHIPSGESCSFDQDLDDDARVWKVGKKAAGRLLGGREWNGVPA